MDDGAALAFEAASQYFVDCVRAVPADRWTTPGLGSWSVRELVAHGNRAHVTIVDYVERPQPPVPPGSDYFSEASIEEAVGFVGRRAARGHGVEVLLALTGRAPLPAGFNVY